MRVESAFSAREAMESVDSSTLAATSSTSWGSPVGQQRVRPAKNRHSNRLFFRGAAIHSGLRTGDR